MDGIGYCWKFVVNLSYFADVLQNGNFLTCLTMNETSLELINPQSRHLAFKWSAFEDGESFRGLNRFNYFSVILVQEGRGIVTAGGCAAGGAVIVPEIIIDQRFAHENGKAVFVIGAGGGRAAPFGPVESGYRGAFCVTAWTGRLCRAA
jgi:hypothetical protein